MKLRMKAPDLTPYQSIFETFEPLTTALFDRMWERTTKPCKRRPNISLRLLTRGEPPGKLVVLPACLVYHGERSIDTQRLFYEFWTERRTNGVVKWQRRLCFRLGGVSRWYHSTAEADLRRCLNTMTAFVEDGRSVLARSNANCCVCGKGLTDELSRSRGIGPECLRLLDWFTFTPPKGGAMRSIVEVMP
jgi:hypothetical protein